VIEVSVIITAYNEVRHISRCLDSLLRQSFDNFEIIVVDDGSTDGTSELVKRYIQQNPEKIRLVKLRMNTGLGNARNIGAHFAKGSIVVFLDADMEFPPNFIANLVKPILSGESKASCPANVIIANVNNLWVRVQGQHILGVGSVERTVFVRAIERDLFLRSGGFDARFGYYDDTTFYMRTGIASVVVKDTFLYHNNPDTVKEILWRNFWIGKSVLKVHRPLDVIVMTLKRVFDLSPPIVIALLLNGGLWFTVLGVALLSAYAITLVRHRVIEPPSIIERLIVRLFYVPAYRFLKALGFLTGLIYSMLGRSWARMDTFDLKQMNEVVLEVVE
jgi:glycosyltransferase involved in cell wall biosynthesis